MGGKTFYTLLEWFLPLLTTLVFISVMTGIVSVTSPFIVLLTVAILGIVPIFMSLFSVINPYFVSINSIKFMLIFFVTMFGLVGMVVFMSSITNINSTLYEIITYLTLLLVGSFLVAMVLHYLFALLFKEEYIHTRRTELMRRIEQDQCTGDWLDVHKYSAKLSLIDIDNMIYDLDNLARNRKVERKVSSNLFEISTRYRANSL